MTTITVSSGTIFFGRSEGARLGYAFSQAGDLDGDGFADLIFGAPEATSRNADGSVRTLAAGEAVVFFGSGETEGAVVDLGSVADGRALALTDDGQSFARLGHAVAGGDLDGDGLGDLLIGTPYRDDLATLSPDAGAVYLRSGSGLAEMADTVSMAVAPASAAEGALLTGSAADHSAGFAVAVAGDVNGDGIEDALFGIPGHSLGDRFGAGAVAVHFGGDALGSGALGGLDGTDGFLIQGAGALDYAGAAVSGAGDFNGDGLGDLIVGAPFAAGEAAESGAAYIVYGTAAARPAVLDLATLDAGSGLRLSGQAFEDQTGVSVAGAGDVNGDGFADVIVGAPGAGIGGIAYVVFGSADPGGEVTLSALDGVKGFRVASLQDGGALGTSVAGIGDVNGDGLDDLLIGAPGEDHGGRVNAGAAYLVLGSRSGFEALVTAADLDGTGGYLLTGGATFDEAGIAVGAAGDMNNDGTADFVIGADGANSGGMTDTGAAYLLHGGTGRLGALDALDGALDGRIALSMTGALIDIPDPVFDLPPVQQSPAPGLLPDGTAPVGAQGPVSEAGADAPVHEEGLIVGTGGGDTLTGADPGERLFGLEGDDLLIARGTGSMLDGGAGDDRIRGSGGDDAVEAGDGADDVRSGGGADRVLLGLGHDRAVAGAGDDRVEGGRGDDLLNGAGGDDLLLGGVGDDRLIGWRGADILSGGAGADVLLGQDGGDRLAGGPGDDRLAGGAGRDVFVFAAFSGRDRVLDFDPLADRLDFRGHGGIDGFEDLTIRQMAAHVLIEDGAGSSVALVGVDAASLSPEVFLF